MRILSLFIILVIVGFGFVGCQNSEIAIVDSAAQFPEVDERLHEYFILFEEEARIRGFEVDLRETSISASIEEIDGQNVAGQCQFGHQAIFDNHIVIDESFLFSNAPSILKEMVVFHELGHCFLQRGHREDAYPSGACVSIMRSGIQDCIDSYNSNTRATYLDELFNPNSFSSSQRLQP
jgi:hypothetical protein